jgi:hypothetical protein
LITVQTQLRHIPSDLFNRHAAMDEGDEVTNPELEQSNMTDGDLDAADDRRVPPTSVPGVADETHSLRAFEPAAPHGPHMGQHFAHSGVTTPSLDLAAVGP